MNIKKRGFTLIELIIVIAIIAIIAAIAIPTILSARKAGNEASAISSLKTLVTVNEQYYTRFRTFPAGFPELETEGYIDSVLASGVKSGYDFFFAGGAGAWVCLGNPRFPGKSGDRYFFADETGVIRFSYTPVASPASSPLQ